MSEKELDKKIINDCLLIFKINEEDKEKQLDKDEQLMSFQLFDEYVKRYLLELDEINWFEKWYNDKELLKKSKDYLKTHTDKLFSIFHFNIESTINKKKYLLHIKLSGLVTDYYRSILKQDMKKFIKDARLMYIHLYEMTPFVQKSIIELGDKKFGDRKDTYTL